MVVSATRPFVAVDGCGDRALVHPQARLRIVQARISGAEAETKGEGMLNVKANGRRL